MKNRNTKLLHVTEVARMVGVSARWLQNEAEAGRLPSLNAGGKYLFDYQAVLAKLKSRARGDSTYVPILKPEGDKE